VYGVEYIGITKSRTYMFPHSRVVACIIIRGTSENKGTYMCPQSRASESMWCIALIRDILLHTACMMVRMHVEIMQERDMGSKKK
jgi:hypothetical protein